MIPMPAIDMNTFIHFVASAAAPVVILFLLVVACVFAVATFLPAEAPAPKPQRARPAPRRRPAVDFVNTQPVPTI